MKSQEEQWLLSDKYGGVKSEAFYTDCKALALGTPLGYLIGQVPFLDCTIYLDEQPLIPRVETEYWVERAIGAMKEYQSIQPKLGENPIGSSQAQARLCVGGFGWGTQGAAESGSDQLDYPLHILDLCAGSGAIGVTVAKALPQARVDFGEIDARLISTISKNIAHNCPDTTTHIFHSNLFQSIPPDRRYDFILSNPPYIDPAIDRATESVKSHEPHLALYGGTGGLDVIEQIISTATPHLTPTGQLWIEHEPEQVASIAKIADEHGFACTSHPDQYSVLRYSVLVIQ